MRTKFLFLGLMGLTVLGLSACQSNQKKPEQKINMGRSYFVKHQYAKAFEKLLTPAKDGVASAQYAIGYMYFYGKGVPQNKPEGKRWIEKAAKQHYALAEAALKVINQ